MSDSELLKAYQSLKSNIGAAQRDALFRRLTGQQSAESAEPAGATRTLFDYWSPQRGVLHDMPGSPGPDYYRLVHNDDEAEAALHAGEPPLHGHRGMHPQDLEKEQFLQWEGPNRLFARTPQGGYTEMGHQDHPFVPTNPGEGYPVGNLRERQLQIEHLQRTAPDMLTPPASHLEPAPELQRDSRLPAGQGTMAVAAPPARPTIPPAYLSAAGPRSATLIPLSDYLRQIRPPGRPMGPTG